MPWSIFSVVIYTLVLRNHSNTDWEEVYGYILTLTTKELYDKLLLELVCEALTSSKSNLSRYSFVVKVNI